MKQKRVGITWALAIVALVALSIPVVMTISHRTRPRTAAVRSMPTAGGPVIEGWSPSPDGRSAVCAIQGAGGADNNRMDFYLAVLGTGAGGSHTPSDLRTHIIAPSITSLGEDCAMMSGSHLPPVWNPAGSGVLCSAGVSGIGAYHPSSRSVSVLSDARAPAYQWIMDGNAVAFYVGSASGGGGAFQVVELSGSRGGLKKSVACEHDTIYSLRWSHAARKLAYVGARVLGNRGLIAQDIYLLDPVRGTCERLTQTGDISPQCPIAWSPDGRRIVFDRVARPKPGSASSASDRLEVIDLETRKSQALLDGDARGTKVSAVGLSWSPDGRRILLDAGIFGGGDQYAPEPGWNRGLYLVDWQSRQITCLPVGRHSEKGFWLPDGKSVLYVHDGREILQIYVAGTTPRRLLTVDEIVSQAKDPAHPRKPDANGHPVTGQLVPIRPPAGH